MPIFIAAIGGMLINLVGTLVGRVLIALGIGVATFTGIQTTLNYLKESAVNSLGALPSEMLGMLSLMKVGVSISIITSAIIAKWIINGLSGDTFKRWIYN